MSGRVGAMQPCRQPPSGKTSARHGREIVEALNEPSLGKSLEHADREAGAADPSAREAQRRTAFLEHGSIQARQADFVAIIGRRRGKGGIETAALGQKCVVPGRSGIVAVVGQLAHSFR